MFYFYDAVIILGTIIHYYSLYPQNKMFLVLLFRSYVLRNSLSDCNWQSFLLRTMLKGTGLAQSSKRSTRDEKSADYVVLFAAVCGDFGYESIRSSLPQHIHMLYSTSLYCTVPCRERLFLFICKVMLVSVGLEGVSDMSEVWKLSMWIILKNLDFIAPK